MLSQLLILSSVNTWKRGKSDELNKIMRMVLFANGFAVLPF